MASRCFSSRSAARRHERGAASGRSSTRCRSRNGGPGDARHPRASISRDALVPAASASPGAPQLTRSASRGASQPAEHTCIFRVVSFNFGYHQSMMTGNRRSVQNHCHTFARLAVRLVTESKADLLLACEIGGYRQGLRQAGIDSADVLSRYFGRRIVCSEIDNYLSVWDFNDDAKIVFSCARDHTIGKGPDVDAMIAQYDIETPGCGRCLLVVGNMHIKSSERAPSVATKQRAVKVLRIRLEGIEPRDKGIPVVRIMVGDNNLTSDELKRALQRGDDEDLLWNVHHTPNDLRCDNVAVCGADARIQPNAVGQSYTSRDMNNDSRDAVGFAITLRGAPPPAKRRRNGSGHQADAMRDDDSSASQPARRKRRRAGSGEPPPAKTDDDRRQRRSTAKRRSTWETC